MWGEGLLKTHSNTPLPPFPDHVSIAFHLWKPDEISRIAFCASFAIYFFWFFCGKKQSFAFLAEDVHQYVSFDSYLESSESSRRYWLFLCGQCTESCQKNRKLRKWHNMPVYDFDFGGFTTKRRSCRFRLERFPVAGFSPFSGCLFHHLCWSAVRPIPIYKLIVFH